MVKKGHLSPRNTEAMKRNWQNPEFRAKMAGRVHCGRPKTLDPGCRYTFYMELEVLNELRVIAANRKCTVSALVRAYIEHGLYLERTPKCPTNPDV